MVAHHLKPENIDPKDPGQFLQSLANPFLAVRIVLARESMLAAQKFPVDTPIDQEKHLRFTASTDLRTVQSWHR